MGYVNERAKAVDKGLNQFGDWVDDTFLGGAEKDAAKDMQEAAEKSQQLIQNRSGGVLEGYQPYVDRGNEAAGLQLEALQDINIPEIQGPRDFSLADFEESPATQFLREQGVRGIGTSRYAQGDRLRELTKMSQGLALQDLARQQSRWDDMERNRINTEQQNINNMFAGKGLQLTGYGDIANTGLSALGTRGGLDLGLLGLETGALTDIGGAKAARDLAGPAATRNLIGQGVGAYAAFAGAPPGVAPSPTTGNVGLPAQPAFDASGYA